MGGFQFVFEVVLRYLPNYLRGLMVSIELTVFSILLGSVLGLVAALARLSRVRPLRLLGTVYVEVIRGVPALVLLLWLYYGLAIVTGLAIPSFGAAIIGLSIYIGAYLAETFRAGILSVPRGQRESALSLGMSEGQAFRRIVMPQAVRLIVPPYGNSLIGLLKDTSLVSVIAISELLREAQYVATATYRTFESYTLAAAIYLIVTTALSFGLRAAERRLSVGQ